jgi:polyhydroxyalkanoate synthase
MGGLLALALAALKPGDVTGLVLMATPLELPRGTDCPGRSTRPAPWKLAAPLLDAYGELPVDIIQSLFSALDPFLVTRKFIDFARTDPASEAAEDFVAQEDLAQ